MNSELMAAAHSRSVTNTELQALDCAPPPLAGERAGFVLVNSGTAEAAGWLHSDIYSISHQAPTLHSV